MRQNQKKLFVIGLFITLAIGGAFAVPFGTSFSYQGRLANAGVPANGIYDFNFSLFDSAGNAVSSTQTVSSITVSNGIFSVGLDFGGAPFNGDARLLQIGVRTNGGGSFTALLPRQPITPTPYSLAASNLLGSLPSAQLTGTLSSGQLSGTYSGPLVLNNPANVLAGNGNAISNVNAATLGGLGSSNFWKTTGNAGTVAGPNFVGTTDNQPLELRINGQRGLRLEPTTNAPNLIGGYSGNYVSNTIGGTVAGGGRPGAPNLILRNFSIGYHDTDASTISGGSGNSVLTGNASTIGGGEYNLVGPGYYAFSGHSTIGGGLSNAISIDYGTVAGGVANSIYGSGGYGTIGGGASNVVAYRWYSTVGGGVGNTNGGTYTTISGGRNNGIFGDDIDSLGAPPAESSSIGGGAWNYIDYGTVGGTIAGGVSNQMGFSSGRAGTIGGGVLNSILRSGADGTIAGGSQNVIGIGVTAATVGGGSLNTVSNDYGVVSGGTGNFVQGINSTVGGGSGNSILPTGGSIAGGSQNFIGSPSPGGTIGGGANNVLAPSLGAYNPYTTIGGGQYNSISEAGGSFIGGGISNTIYFESSSATISGGQNNVLEHGTSSTISGGSGNISYSFATTIGGGANNFIDGSSLAGPNSTEGTIGGGSGNTLSGFAVAGTIAGGLSNLIGSGVGYQFQGTIGGGYGNVVTTKYATIPGGQQAKASQYGQMAYASGQFSNVGDAQTSTYVSRTVTTNGTQTELYLDGVSERIAVPTNSTWFFEVFITGKTTSGSAAVYSIRGGIKNINGTTSLIGATDVFTRKDVPAWDAIAVADDTNDALVIKVTGASGTTIRWVATVRTSEVTF